MVGLVIVSHSRTLAEGLVQLIRQVASPDLKLAVATGAGLDHQELGTDANQIAEAIQQVYSPDGVLVLMDLGSAILSAEMALDLIPQEMRPDVRLCSAPLVEGAMAAAVQSGLGSLIDQVYQEARMALHPKQAQLGDSLEEQAVALEKKDAVTSEVFSRKVILKNQHGLHVRPAARFIQTAGIYKATVLVRNLSRGKGPAAARSLNSLALLEADQGDEIEITATGRQAEQALQALETLVGSGFGRPEQPESPALAIPKPAQVDHAIQAQPVSPGVALGKAQIFQPSLPVIDPSPSGSPDEEWQSLKQALQRVRVELVDRQEKMKVRLGEAQAAIFAAHRLILEDPALLEQVQSRIDVQRQSAAFAWQEVIEASAAALQNVADAYLRQRCQDVRDVGSQVLRVLCGSSDKPHQFEQPVILVADELTPTDVTRLEADQVLGLVTFSGAASGHSAILARSLGIPAVTGLDRLATKIKDGVLLGLDGDQGAVWIDPPAKVRRELAARRQKWLRARQAWLEACRLPAQTRDGRKIDVAANVGSLLDARTAIQNGAQGIGVLRTEFLFLKRSTPPGEEEQLQILNEISSILNGLPVIVRTLDVGGDKELPSLHLEKEANPFLGVRGIRLSFRHPDLFLTQVRAILRCGVNYPVRILLPMVANLEEIRQAKTLIEQAHRQLAKEKLSHLWPAQVGIMVEIPSAAMLSPHLAPEVDFFSIGTNDLTQYTLAAERGNPALNELADALHPAVLQQIKMVVEAAHQQGKWTGVCGEVAGDPQATAILLGLGVDELSMNPVDIPQIKAVIRDLNIKKCKRIARKALDYSK